MSGEVVYGPLRRCVNPAHRACEASQPDCVVELIGMVEPVARMTRGDEIPEMGYVASIDTTRDHEVVDGDWRREIEP